MQSFEQTTFWCNRFKCYVVKENVFHFHPSSIIWTKLHSHMIRMRNGEMSKSQRVGCVIPHCNLHSGIAKPILQFCWHICTWYSHPRSSLLFLCLYSALLQSSSSSSFWSNCHKGFSPISFIPRTIWRERREGIDGHVHLIPLQQSRPCNVS